MEKLEIKGDIILWTVGSNRWLIDYEELTTAYLNGRHPFTNAKISTSIQNKLLSIIRVIAGGWYVTRLKKIKNYQRLNIQNLQQLKSNAQILGSGKYATVYLHRGHAVKVIKHRNYSHLSRRTDGKIEANILTYLQKRLSASLITPNILTIYQYTPDQKIDYIVCERLDQTLYRYLQSKPNTKIIRGILLQIIFTLAVLQHLLPSFRHNDLKVDNILLDFTPRKQRLSLQFKKQFWSLPSDIPLVKIADFDYSNIPKKYDNPKVGTSFACTFGCTAEASKIYDLHLILNSVYSYRRFLPSTITTWLEKQLPETTRGTDNGGVRFGRLRRPQLWTRKIPTPLKLLADRFFSEYQTYNPTYPIWGIK